jgi:Arm DNA-binding domain
MAINKLKDRQIENLPLGPKGKAKLHADGGGLFVNVRGEPRSESRSYVFKGTLHGEQLTKYIGATAKTSLAGARAERDKFNEQIKAGKDPRKEAAKRKAKQRSTAERTVASMLDRYFEKRIERRRKYDTDEKQEERCRKATRHLNLIRDKLGKVPVAEVDTEMLTTNLPGFEEWSGAELRMHIRRAFAHVVALGWRNGCDPKNPASKEILDELLPNEYRSSLHRRGKGAQEPRYGQGRQRPRNYGTVAISGPYRRPHR